jgi:hypothetical protein
MSRHSAIELVREFRRLGVELAPHGDKIRYRPKGAVSQELLARLAACKGDVLDLLQAEKNGTARCDLDGRRPALRCGCGGVEFWALVEVGSRLCAKCSELDADESQIMWVRISDGPRGIRRLRAAPGEGPSMGGVVDPDVRPDHGALGSGGAS